MVSCKKCPTRHAYAWQIGPFWQDTLNTGYGIHVLLQLNWIQTWLNHFHSDTLHFESCQLLLSIVQKKHSVHYHIEAETNGSHFADDIFKCIFLNENVWILIKISLKFVPEGPINNIPAMVQIMAWRRPGNKPLSDPKMVSLRMHKCIARPQWVIQELIGYWR